MEEKRCPKCMKSLPVDQFSLCRTRKTGLAPYCKQCHRNYYEENKQRRAEYAREWHKTHPNYSKKAGIKNRDNWAEYFTKRYGGHPECELCGKQLEWTGRSGNFVTFDHRNGGEEYIKLGPSSWKSQVFSLKNIKLWESCDFGILCTRCNSNLPTNLIKRRERLTRFITYLKKCGA